LRPGTDEVVELSDGRRLGFAVWGSPDGRPLFQFHGSPAGRLDRWGDESLLERLNVRLITTDRPGIGRSDRRPGRRVIDWPDDVRQLADKLNTGRFGVIGFSSGGAYAAACALRLADRVSGVALVSPIGRVDERGVDGMGVAPYLKLARRAPWAMGAIYAGLAMMARRSPERAHDQFWRGATRVDRDVVDRPAVRERYWPALTDALGRRGRGIVEEMRTVQCPWGFDPAEITVLVDLFHGTADRIVPPAHARYWVETLADSRVRWYEGEGHFLIEDRFEDILRALLSDNG
jgi:pimeloyl-ACP methyl ester carboxylesterase